MTSHGPAAFSHDAPLSISLHKNHFVHCDRPLRHITFVWVCWVLYSTTAPLSANFSCTKAWKQPPATEKKRRRGKELIKYMSPLRREQFLPWVPPNESLSAKNKTKQQRLDVNTTEQCQAACMKCRWTVCCLREAVFFFLNSPVKRPGCPIVVFGCGAADFSPTL